MTEPQPIEFSKVQVGDKIRISKECDDGTSTVYVGKVEQVVGVRVDIACCGTSFAISTRQTDSVTTSLFLLHRPPQRKEVTLDQLIREVPIGTRVALVKLDGGEIDGTLQVVGRDGRGLGVHLGPNISSTIYVNLDGFKTAYIQEEAKP